MSWAEGFASLSVSEQKETVVEEDHVAQVAGDVQEEDVASEPQELQEACGVFGVVSSSPWPSQLDVSNILCLGLIGLQHRGQESAGIVTSYGREEYKVFTQKGMGLVSQIFNEDNLQKLKGNLGIAHTRYSTAGSTSIANCQPFVVETKYGLISVAHNGELVNSNPLKQMLLERGVGLSTGSDSELITQILSLAPNNHKEIGGPDFVARIKQLMKYTPAAYSLVVMYKDVIYAVRDPYGNRPLCLGNITSTSLYSKIEENEEVEGYVVSSESCPFQSIGAKYYREVMPGEIVRISREGIQSLDIVPTKNHSPTAFCIFEYVYFARADSIMEGQTVYTARFRCGERLGRESPVPADIVCTVPESATPSAIGYSKVTGTRYAEVLCKNRYVGRSFIQPSTRLRKLAVQRKFGVLSENVKGKRIVLIDDSIVRGNTMSTLVSMLKGAGAKEIHIRIASPPLHHPCYMGINIPTKDELIANKLNAPALAKHLGADSLEYLSIEGLLESVSAGRKQSQVKDKSHSHCTACLTGNYPMDLNW